MVVPRSGNLRPLRGRHFIVGLGATAGLSSSGDGTVGQANRGTRQFVGRLVLRYVREPASVRARPGLPTRKETHAKAPRRQENGVLRGTAAGKRSLTLFCDPPDWPFISAILTEN